MGLFPALDCNFLYTNWPVLDNNIVQRPSIIVLCNFLHRDFLAAPSERNESAMKAPWKREWKLDESTMKARWTDDKTILSSIHRHDPGGPSKRLTSRWMHDLST